MQLLSNGLLALLLASVPATSLAADSYCPDSDPSRRVVLLSVLDSQGNPVTALSAADLRAEFRGQAVKLHSVAPARAARVVLLLDTSVRMTQTPSKWRLTLAAASDLHSRLPPDIPLALVTFDDVVRSTVGFDHGRDAVAQSLAAFRSPSWAPNRGTYGNPLPEAIQAGLMLLGPARPGDVIYVITDGKQFGGDVDKGMPEVERTLIAYGVRLFAIEFEGIGAIFFAGGRLLQIVERTGGGTLVFKPSGARDPHGYDEKMAAELSARAAAFAAQMQGYHRLEIELSRPVDKLQDWKLEVVDDRGRRRKDLTLIYPRKLAPCPGRP